MVEELVVNIDHSPITLKENRMVDANLQAAESDIFLHYLSGQQFNITLGVVYGSLTVSVFEYGNEEQPAFEQNFSHSVTTSIPIEVPEEAASSHLKYIIKVTAVRDSSYHMQISNVENKLSISQGVPLKIQLPSGKTQVAFDSVTSTGNFELFVESSEENTFISSLECRL